MKKHTIREAIECICEVAQCLNDEDQNDLWFKLNKAVQILQQVREKIGGAL